MLFVIIVVCCCSFEDDEGTGVAVAGAQAGGHLERGEDAAVRDLHGYSGQVPRNVSHW